MAIQREHKAGYVFGGRMLSGRCVRFAQRLGGSMGRERIP